MRRAGPHHREALVHGVRRVTGLDTTTEGIPVQGMLDPDIIALMLRAVGVETATIAASLPEIMAAAEDFYAASVPDLRDKTCPGVIPLLEELTARGTALALVTGNLTRIGWRKLERAGLDHYFRFGAFGEMAPTRGGLARLAIERARREGLIASDSRVALVGDAPQDIQAARESGAFAIAVRTGITPPGELEAGAPDMLLEDLTFLDLAGCGQPGRIDHLK